MSEGTVYVIQSGAYYKIGRTQNMEKRLNALQGANPSALTVCYQLETPASDTLERYLHRRFHEVRVIGEWFTLAAADVDWIRSIQQWTQDDAKQAGMTPRLAPSKVRAQLGPGSLGAMLPHYGIPSIAELRRRLGLTKQYAWLLWHGKIAVSSDMLRRLHGELGLPLEALIQVERAEPAKRRGRKPLRARAKGRRSSPPKEQP